MFETSQRVDPEVELPALTAAIAALPAPSPGGSAAVAGNRLRALMMLRRRLDAAFLAEIGCFDTQGLSGGLGFPTTASWLRAVGSLDGSQASKLVKTARTAEVLPLLTAELAAGHIDVEHLHVLSRAVRDVPPEEVARHDITLRDLALAEPPSAMAVAGKTITGCWRHDLAEADRERLREIRRFDVASTVDGLWHVDGLLPLEVGAQLATLIEPLAQRRGPEDDRTPTQRRADALAELLDGALRHSPLPDAAGERPRLTLVLEVGRGAAGDDTDRDSGPAVLVGEMLGRSGLARAMIADGSLLAAFGPGSAANLVGASGQLSPQTLARLACEADVGTAVVDRLGQLLSLGRSSRFPNLVQRRALVVRDRGCVFPGCTRPPAGCIAHHVRFWSRGGATDLDNLALVCHYHHHLVHEDGWTLHRIDPCDPHPHGGWRAASPRGYELTEFRQPAA